MTHHLVITAIGADRPGISNLITQLVTKAGCNIVDSRIELYGSEFTLIMLLSGNANGISRVESTLPLISQEHDLITIMKRTTTHHEQSYTYLLEMQIESEDKPGLTEQFTQFFADRKIDIASLSAQTITTDESTGALHQFLIQITARLPEECHLMQLQEEFEYVCTKLSVTGSLNFIKNSQ